MKKLILLVLSLFLLFPLSGFTKQNRSIKVFLEVSADDPYKVRFTNSIRTQLREPGDVVFTDQKHAQFIIDIVLIVQNQGHSVISYSQVLEQVSSTDLFRGPFAGSLMTGSNLDKMEDDIVANINEAVFEPIRESNP